MCDGQRRPPWGGNGIEAELNIQLPISKYASTPKLQISNGTNAWGFAWGFGFVTCGNRQIPKHQAETNNHSTRIDVPNGLGNWDLETAISVLPSEAFGKGARRVGVSPARHAGGGTEGVRGGGPLSGAVLVDALDVDPLPARSLGQLSAGVDVDAFVCEQVDVEPVAFVEFEDAETAGFRPLAPDLRQEVVPALPGRQPCRPQRCPWQRRT
jgi:hypothetical protein